MKTAEEYLKAKNPILGDNDEKTYYLNDSPLYDMVIELLEDFATQSDKSQVGEVSQEQLELAVDKLCVLDESQPADKWYVDVDRLYKELGFDKSKLNK